MTDHIADRAGFLAALSKDDPERRAAEAHAQTCAPCADALDEGFRLIAVLQEALPLPPPTPEALARAAIAIERETADERAAMRRVSLIAAGAVAVSWLFQLTVGSGFVLDTEHAALSLPVLAIAIACAMLTLLRGRQRLAIGIAVVTSGLMAFTASTHAGLEAGIGIRCMFRELWAAVIPWVVVPLAAKREGVPIGRWDVIGIATSGALAAHAGQHMACKVPHAEGHLFVFHFSAIIIVTLLSAYGARKRPALARY